MFGVNYTGASRLLQLDPSKYNKAQLQKEIDKIKNAPDMQNNETKYQEAMNQIKQYVVGMGQGIAELKIQGMDMVVTGIDKITNYLGLGNNDAIFSDQQLAAYDSRGESMEGAWALKKSNYKEDDFRALMQRKGDKGFGDLTFKLAGLDNNEFVKWLWNNKLDEGEGTFRGIVKEAASDSIITASEQSTIEKAINRLYELWKTELKTVTVQEDS